MTHGQLPHGLGDGHFIVCYISLAHDRDGTVRKSPSIVGIIE